MAQLTKNEALEAMKRGKKIAHDLFTAEEWVMLDPDGNYEMEDGVRLSPDEFWLYRKEEYWQRDWRIVDEDNNISDSSTDNGNGFIPDDFNAGSFFAG